MHKSSPLEKQAQQWLPKPLVVAAVSPPQQAVLFSWEQALLDQAVLYAEAESMLDEVRALLSGDD